MADDEKVTCKNPPCSCPVDKKGDYCSVTCESVGKSVTIDCDCGHAECKGDF
jgi:hypothetical protein